MTVVLPLPPHGLTANSHLHWRVIGPAKKEYRALARVRACESMPSDWTPCRVRLSFEWFMGRTAIEKATKAAGAKAKPRHYRPNDSANALTAMKAAIDGLVDAGVTPDDSHKWVEIGGIVLHRSEKEHKGRSCVVLTIEEIG